MRKTSILLAGAACAALNSGIAQAQQSADTRVNQLEQRVDALEAELQAAEMRQAKDRDTVTAVSAANDGAWWKNTSIDGRMYFDISSIEQKTNGVKSGTNNGLSFDIKRFYVGINHKFDDTFSANITTDFQYDGGAGASQIYIKKAYLDIKLDDALDIRLGSTDTPWVPFVEGLYGNRHLENVLIDKAKFGTSADWGVHFAGKFAGGLLNYAISVVNGAGYKKAPYRTQNMDVEGRVNLAYQGFTLGIGGYSGYLGTQYGTQTKHTAQRFDAIAAYTSSDFRLGVEYFTADNWKNVTTTATDSADGYSVYGQYYLTPQWSAFGRYDWINPNKTTNPTLDTDYYNVGVTYSPAKIVDLSLVYKHDSSSSVSSSSSASEVGIFGQLRW